MPTLLTPLPRIAMSWGTLDAFFILIVTLPAVALALEARNFSCPLGSASI